MEGDRDPERRTEIQAEWGPGAWWHSCRPSQDVFTTHKQPRLFLSCLLLRLRPLKVKQNCAGPGPGCPLGLQHEGLRLDWQQHFQQEGRVEALGEGQPGGPGPSHLGSASPPGHPLFSLSLPLPPPASVSPASVSLCLHLSLALTPSLSVSHPGALSLSGPFSPSVPDSCPLTPLDTPLPGRRWVSSGNLGAGPTSD